MNPSGQIFILLVSVISGYILALRNHVVRKVNPLKWKLQTGSDKFDGYALLFDCDGVIVETEVRTI